MPPHASRAPTSFLKSSTRGPSFSRGALSRADLDADPLLQFARWFQEASREAGSDPAAMTLATVGTDGGASARTVSLKDVDERGFVFTSHYDGPKGREVRAEPRVALVFYWPGQGRQVRVAGTAERLPSEESARYFAARSTPMQLALMTGPPSRPVPDRTTLDASVAALAGALADGGTLPHPPWGGYLVRPRSVEFWQGRADRLHDRFLYRAAGDRWDITRLTP